MPSAEAQAVRSGVPLAQALRGLLGEAGGSRVLLLTNTALAGAGGIAEEVRHALGARCAGTLAGLRAHAPMEDVLRTVEAVRATQANAVVAVGGGSVCSVLKVARLAHARGVGSLDALRALAPAPAAAAGMLYAIMIPTTLSAGECTSIAGARDPASGTKTAFAAPGLRPDAVVLDPRMMRATPARLWLATGVRAVDHAVETWCSPGAGAAFDETALRALQLLLPGLRASRGDAVDDATRLTCQQGARLAIAGLAAGVPQGASHGMGHVLGAMAGMAHGDTSCVLLPHVLRYNAAVNGARQQGLAAALGWTGSLAAGIADFVASLGLPSRLRDAGVGRKDLGAIARRCPQQPWVVANPRPMDATAAMELLELAW